MREFYLVVELAHGVSVINRLPLLIYLVKSETLELKLCSLYDSIIYLNRNYNNEITIV